MIPEGFKNKVASLSHFDFDKFINVLETDAPISIRTHKIKGIALIGSEKVPWCDHAYYLDSRPVFTLDPHFHAGCYYVQEASSMFLWFVLQTLYPEDKNQKILDLCASPGGKSTLIADFLNGEGCLVTNEVIKARANTLLDNMTKWGYPNVVVTNGDPLKLGQIENLFDAIVVDAPCSGEGMWRKDPQAINEWSEAHVDLCSARQQRIVTDILPSLKPGGQLIYSTCTYNANENIDNIIWMCEQHDLESIRIDVPSEWGIAEVEKEGVTGYQFLPYQIKGEGFFISILKKKNEKANEKEKPHNTKINMLSKKEKIAVDEWLNDEGQELSILKSPNDAIYLATNQAAELFNTLANKVRVMLTGIKIGKLNKNLFLPDHGLAMSNLVNSDIPKIALEKEEALDYLRKKLYQVEDENKGWVIITYQDSQLGWIKNLGNRINNYLPNEFMIRNL